MKTCFKCKIEKPLTEFYKHKQMSDGLLGKCKSCCKADVRKNYRANITHYKEYDRKRAHLPHRLELRKVNLNSNLMCIIPSDHNACSIKPNSIESRANLFCHIPSDHKSYPSISIQKSWCIKNPKKKKANGMVSSALASGKLIKGCCEECGTNKNIHGHHNDYNKPLDVRWLCAKHHNDHHRRIQKLEQMGA